MLVTASHIDLQTSSTPMRVYTFTPNLPQYPDAKFPAIIVHTEIYQVTGPVSRFATQIASHGYVVACPSSYHEFTGPAALAYDEQGTDDGNRWKVEKHVAAYDEDSRLVVDWLLGSGAASTAESKSKCNGRIGVTGMCLGGHLAYRSALDPRVRAAVCFFATDMHKASLGAGGDDSLKRAAQIKGELVMIFGKRDTHVPRAGRDLIRRTLEDAGVEFSWYEIAGAQHAFIRDESSKGRYDAAVTGVCWGMLMECFERAVKADLGARVGEEKEPEDVC